MLLLLFLSSSFFSFELLVVAIGTYIHAQSSPPPSFLAAQFNFLPPVGSTLQGPVKFGGKTEGHAGGHALNRGGGRAREESKQKTK